MTNRQCPDFERQGSYIKPEDNLEDNPLANTLSPLMGIFIPAYIFPFIPYNWWTLTGLATIFIVLSIIIPVRWYCSAIRDARARHSTSPSPNPRDKM